MPRSYPACNYGTCTRRAYYNYPNEGEIRPTHCNLHRDKNMINVCRRICRGEGCGIEPSFNLPTEQIPIFCVKHKSAEMVDVKNKRCSFNYCNRQPSYKWPSDIENLFAVNPDRFCAEHAKAGMVCYRRWYGRTRCNKSRCSYQSLRLSLPPNPPPYCFTPTTYHCATNMSLQFESTV